jgi:uncharacterized protein (TIGR02001 family)
LTALKPGKVTVTAVQSAALKFGASKPFTISVFVKGRQSITAPANVEKLSGDPDVTIAYPISQSTGKWSAASSDPTIAAISGNQIKLGNAGTLSGSVGVASQYVFRGIDSNRDKPAVFGSVEYQTPAFGAIKPYLGIFGSQFAVSYEDSDQPTDATAFYELDYSVGIRTSLGKLNIDLGYVLMTYEGGRNERNLQTAEYGVKLSYPVDKLTLNANYFLISGSNNDRLQNAIQCIDSFMIDK